MYKKKLLLSHLIVDAYSLSAKIVYHFEDKSCPSKSHEVLTPLPAGPENPIANLISS